MSDQAKPGALRLFVRNLRVSLNVAGTTPANRLRAWTYIQFFDHALLRGLWTNHTQIATGVYRSNHPSPRRLRAFHKSGGKTVLSLRAPANNPITRQECDACDALGLKLVHLPLSATKAPSREALRRLIILLKGADKPLLIHCKSGADRTGLASAVYLLAIEGQSVKKAKSMLSLRYIHFSWTEAGVLDAILTKFEDDHRRNRIGFVEWVNRSYDPAAFDQGI